MRLRPNRGLPWRARLGREPPKTSRSSRSRRHGERMQCSWVGDHIVGWGQTGSARFGRSFTLPDRQRPGAPNAELQYPNSPIPSPRRPPLRRPADTFLLRPADPIPPSPNAERRTLNAKQRTSNGEVFPRQSACGLLSCLPELLCLGSERNYMLSRCWKSSASEKSRR